MYGMWKIMCFLTLNCIIALHQIHKIVLFLVTSYDTFNVIWHHLNSIDLC